MLAEGVNVFVELLDLLLVHQTLQMVPITIVL